MHYSSLTIKKKNAISATALIIQLDKELMILKVLLSTYTYTQRRLSGSHFQNFVQSNQSFYVKHISHITNKMDHE